MWITTAWQSISPKVTVKGFKKCCISNEMGGTDECCRMVVTRMGMLVSGRNIKAQTVEMETVTLIGKGR